MSRRFWEDLAERVATTWACSFVGLLIAGGRHWHTMPHITSAAVSALAAAAMTAKGLISRKVGDPNSAGLMPAAPKGSTGGGQ
ncbi:hypothetical protein ABH931_006168 [Streptacidiphilus sp. MAP12-33]|uniref:hypothetical protein n=1 Tax=Streptacidiphilus sp. MAP12-33 TaxID=3156266 RepID=UPI0035179267